MISYEKEGDKIEMDFTVLMIVGWVVAIVFCMAFSVSCMRLRKLNSSGLGSVAPTGATQLTEYDSKGTTQEQALNKKEEDNNTDRHLEEQLKIEVK